MPAAVAAIGLVAAIIAVLLPGPATPVRPASDVPRQPRRLFFPFTGEPVPSLGPVLAGKIGNLAPARPQTGLTGADLVYVIPVRAVRAYGPAPGRARVPGGAAGPVRTADGTLVAPGTFRVHHHD